MSCPNYQYQNFSKSISISCGIGGVFSIFRCIFSSLSTGPSILLSHGTELNSFSIVDTQIKNCTDGAIKISGQYNGTIRKCCFYKDFASIGSVLCSSATKTSNLDILQSSNAFCPENKKGSYYVYQLSTLNLKIENTNSSYSMMKYHTMFDMYNIELQNKFNTLCHNGMGCVYRTSNVNGVILNSNHYNSTVVDHDWSFLHNHGSTNIVYETNVFLFQPYSSFVYFGGASKIINSVILECKFSAKNISYTPTYIECFHIDANECNVMTLDGFHPTRKQKTSAKLSIIIFIINNLE